MNTQNASPTLEDLAAFAQCGDQQAFRRIVEQTREMAFAVAFRLLTNEEEAREVAHESYIRIWKALDQYDPARCFTTWFYQIVTNTALDRLRSRSRWRRLFTPMNTLQDDPGHAMDAAGTMDNEHLGRTIRQLTEDLPLKQRAVFVLRDLQDLTTEETATILKMSNESVKTNLHHARRRIRLLLEERFGITQEDI
jgi:RNA polymerase sigma-70 factor (ECF subfamily)